MTAKERELLFKINEAVIKISQAPQTTNTALTGEVYETPAPQPAYTPLPLPLTPQSQG